MSVFENTLSVFGDPLSVFENIEFPNTLSRFQIHSMSVFGRTIKGWTTTDVVTEYPDHMGTLFTISFLRKSSSRELE